MKVLDFLSHFRLNFFPEETFEMCQTNVFRQNILCICTFFASYFLEHERKKSIY